jgi:hypothetical protein
MPELPLPASTTSYVVKYGSGNRSVNGSLNGVGFILVAIDAVAKSSVEKMEGLVNDRVQIA